MKLGSQAIGQNYNPTIQSGSTAQNYCPLFIQWFHKSGGRKKYAFLGMENFPFTDIKFEENLKLMGAGDISFAFIDFPIHVDDYVKIYYNDNIIWEGLVDSEPDPKKGAIKLVPYSNRFQELLINKSYTSQTIDYMLQDIVEELQADTGISYDSINIDTGDTSTYSIDFIYVEAKSALDDLVGKLDDREWGIDKNKKFCVYQKHSSIDYILFDANDKWFNSVERKVSNDKIPATRYQVFKKDSSGIITRVGEVGYGGLYPTLAIEKVRRKIVGRYDIEADNVSDAFCLQLAYSVLESEAVLNETVTIKNVRPDKINASIGDYIKVIDSVEKSLIILKDSSGYLITDYDTNWTNATEYTTDYVSGVGCIQMSGTTPAGSEIIYDFTEIKRFFSSLVLNFMCYSVHEVGKKIEISFSDTLVGLWTTDYQIWVNTIGVWEAKQIPLTETHFRYMAIRLNHSPASSVTYRFGDFRLWTYGRQEYEGVLVQKKWKIDKKGINVDYILSEYDDQANDDFFKLSRELEKIKTIQYSS